MADPTGPTSNPLIEKLAEQPFAFDFFAAGRLLQAFFSSSPRLGYSWSPAQDPIRFAQSPALDFASATLEALKQKDGSPPVLYSRHFGLFGPNGPMPLCFTEFARERILHHHDPTLAAFCNIFHHRLLSFLFRAWADAQKTVDFDRPTEQLWPQFAGSVVGLGMASLLHRDSVPDRAKFFFAGRLVQQSRNAEGLEAIIQDFFALPTQLHTFVGRWLDVPANSICKLGASPETGALGLTTIVGSRFWTCQLHFRIRLGPMRLVEYERMLPTGSSFRRLCDWVREYSGDHFSWDAQLVLAKEEVPLVQLGVFGRLGWTTWLRASPFDHDAEDLVLQSRN